MQSKENMANQYNLRYCIKYDMPENKGNNSKAIKFHNSNKQYLK